MRGLAALALVVLLAACSSGKHETKPPPVSTTTLAPTSTSTSTPGSSTTTTPSTTVPRSTTTTTTDNSSTSVQITEFTYVGSTVVECNAPTMFELKWATAGATNVEMFIDGGPRFARYPNGARDELLPLACDGKTHTYELVATAPGGSTSRSLSVTTKKTA